MNVMLYGLPNCDTVKKARSWLDSQGVAYEFRDYKKEGADPAKLKAWAAAKGWETILNRSGTTFRKLPDDAKQGLDEAGAIALMLDQPSMIKRPVVEYPGGLLVGFKEPEWAAALG
jgi:Spx/MgsR family transcriptional regulator